jgi:hypothetical protein
MNWFYVAANALWIFALAWGLALLGTAYWESATKNVTISKVFSRNRQRGSLQLMLMLFSVGLGLITGAIWGKVLWLALAALSLFLAWKIFHLEKKS